MPKFEANATIKKTALIYNITRRDPEAPFADPTGFSVNKDLRVYANSKTVTIGKFTYIWIETPSRSGYILEVNLERDNLKDE